MLRVFWHFYFCTDISVSANKEFTDIKCIANYTTEKQIPVDTARLEIDNSIGMCPTLLVTPLRWGCRVVGAVVSFWVPVVPFRTDTRKDFRISTIQGRMSNPSNPPVFTDRVRSTMGRLCFDTCLSVCPHLGGSTRPGPEGGVPHPDPGRGYSPVEPARGYPCWGGCVSCWGVPHLGYPPSDLVGGYPCRGGVPCQGGYPAGEGVPHLR